VRSFDKFDVEKSFDPVILGRGRQYVKSKKVVDAWYDEFGNLLGIVQGTDYDPYEVEIVFKALYPGTFSAGILNDSVRELVI
jgi:uncharacterized Zn finger protein